MTRYIFIERIIRQIYGGQPTADSDITFNLVNEYLNDGIGIAAKKNYTDAIQLDGIGYVNNSFYSTFKGISISADENFKWSFPLPQVPVGVGRNEGISDLLFKSADNKISLNAIPLSINQQGYSRSMRPVPNKVLYYYQGNMCFVLTTIPMDLYTAQVTMISGGDSTDLDSNINVPDDYFPIIVEYIKGQLAFERAQPQDLNVDGVDNK